MWRFVLRENIRRFETLMEKASSASERDHLRGLLQQSQAELAELELASTPELARNDEALKSFSERAVDEAMNRHRAQFSTLQIYDDTRDHLIILAQRNFRASFLHHLAGMRPGDGSACGRCLQDAAAAAIEDVRKDSDFRPHLAPALEAGFHAVQASPVTDASGELIAVLSTYFASPHHFSEEAMDRMTTYAASIGRGLAERLRRSAPEDQQPCVSAVPAPASPPRRL